MTRTDEHYMRQAIQLARKGVDRPSSLPLMGVVVVSTGRIVGRSFAGTNDSDSPIVAALNEAGQASNAATVYTNFEPARAAADRERVVDRLIESNPSRVVIGAIESSRPTPESANLVEELKRAGVAVEIGVREEECLELNERFLKYRQTGMPFVTVKFAQSLDGRIATSTGDSQWISSAASLRLAHQLRREHDAIMVGIGTVLRDDPQLTVRLVDGHNPLRVVVDSRLRVPPTARVLERRSGETTIVATTESADRAGIRELEQAGVEVLVLPGGSQGGGVRLPDLLHLLGERAVASVLVEGGAGIITSLLAERLVDRLVIAIAPKLIGSGIEAIGNLGITRLADAISLSSVKTRRLGPDLIFDARLG